MSRLSPVSVSRPPILSFGAEPVARLLKRYDINPKKVSVFTESAFVTPAVLAEIEADKPRIIGHLLQAHEHARKNALLGNHSGRFYATSVELQNGATGLGSNIELDREEVFCGERAALVMAWNQALDNTTLGSLERGAVNSLKKNRVKRLYSTSSKPIGTDRVGVYCADCQSWMAQQSYFSPETQVLTLEKEGYTGPYRLRVRVLKDYDGPCRLGKVNAWLIETALLRKLPLEITDKARDTMARLSVSEEDCRGLLRQAQRVALKTLAPSVAALAKNSEGNVRVESVRELHWTPRWRSSADLTAAHAAISKVLSSSSKSVKAAASRVVALAYMGYATPPQKGSLGRFSQDLGGLDTLIIRPAFSQARPTQPIITISTLHEELPFVYASSVNKQ